MIIIRKLSVILILLVVITSLSFTAFAAGEQPSGSAYSYVTAAGGTGTSNYWTAATNSLLYIGQDIHTIGTNMPSGTNYTYYNGSTRYSNLWSAITNGLSYIGLEAYTIQGDTASIRSSASDIKQTVSDIKSSLPTTSTYSYTTNTGNTVNTTFWNASNNQLGYIHSRLGSVLDKVTSLDNKFIDYSTLLSAISSSVSNIYTKTTAIELDTSSINTSSTSIASDISSIKPKLTSIDTSTQSIDTTTQSIDTKVGNIYSYISTNNRMPSGSNFYYWNNSGSGRANYWNAVTYTLSFMSRNIEDLHTMFASPEDLALKADQDNNISSATTNFLSGNDSATSVGTGSIGKVKDLGDGAASFFDTGVNATSLFTLLSDTSNDGPWTWFTQAVADDLDAVAAANRNSRSNSSSEDVVDFYSDKMAALDRLLGSIAEVDTRKSENYVYTSSDFQPDPNPWEVDVLD